MTTIINPVDIGKNWAETSPNIFNLPLGWVPLQVRVQLSEQIGDHAMDQIGVHIVAEIADRV